MSPSCLRAAASEANVEAELDLPNGFLEEDELAALAELAPEDEPGLVLARRVFADGRTRAYAWGRALAREDLAAAAERLIAMSGQFEQRRLARPAYQLDVLDTFCGDEQLRRLAERAQVITITHLPQIASVADIHYRVEKVPGDPTHTRIERLDDAQRRDELERMLGGREFISTLR